MKRFRNLSLVLLLACTVGHAQTQPVSLCYEDADLFPWLTKDGKGLSNVLMEMASARSKVRIEQTAMPWKRCLLELSRGSVAGVVGASFNDERAAYAQYPTTAEGALDLTRRMSYDTYSVYRRKGVKAAWDGKAFTELSGPVGVQMGYSVTGDLQKLGIPADETARSAESVMKMLILGRYELGSILTLEGDDLLGEKEFADKLEKLPSPLSGKPYFLIFGKDFYRQHQKAADDLWAGVASARESKEFVVMRKAAFKK